MSSWHYKNLAYLAGFWFNELNVSNELTVGCATKTQVIANGFGACVVLFAVGGHVL